MKVLTYNVHGWQAPAGGSNLDLVTEVLAASAADVVGLNEVFHPAGATDDSALSILAARLGMAYVFGATQPSVPHPAHPPYGNALLSRWPIVAHAAHHLSPALSYGKRGLLEVRLSRPSGDMFTVYVTHLDHRSEEVRRAQWAAANTWLLRDCRRPHLLFGDFNALAQTDYATPDAVSRLAAYQAQRGWPVPAFSLVDQVLKAGYSDAFVAAGNPPMSGATYPASAPERRIDYIFLPSSMAGTLQACAPLSHELGQLASDHVAVFAELAV